MKSNLLRGCMVIALSIVVGTGSAQNWRVDNVQQTNPLIDSNTQSAVAIDPVTGQAFVRTQAPAAGPSVSVTGPSAGAPSATVTVSWSAASFTGNVSCDATTGSGATGWSATGLGSSGSRQVTLPASQGSITLGMTCTGQNGSASGSLTINVSSNNCTGANAPNYQGLGIQGSTAAFNSFAWPSVGQNFPGFTSGGTNGEQFFSIQSNFVALSFVMPSNTPPAGRFQSTQVLNGAFGDPIVSLTECPGVFNDASLLCYGPPQTTSKSGLDWKVQGAPDARCELIPGRTYHLNIGAAVVVGGAYQWGCGSGPACNFKITALTVNN
jgi:hypothetical protein